MSRCTRDQIQSLATLVGVSVEPDEEEAYADAIEAEFRGYQNLAEVVESSSQDESVTGLRFDPGDDTDPLNAFTSVFDPLGAEGPLSDLDVGVKDNVAVAGAPMTCGSRVFESATPGRHATVVDRLVSSGASIVGKTNMDELAYGPTSETSGFAPVANPVNDEHVAGGSSSGSAAAVGAEQVDAAIGTDTGGSVRIPASFCGVVGFKPTWGLVPRTGVVELAYTLDHVGPIARDIRTAARVFDAISGPDDGDPSSVAALKLEGSAQGSIADRPDVGTLSFGLVDKLFGPHVDAEVKEVIRAQVDELEAAGATVESVSIPEIDVCVHVWNAITNAEFADTLRSALVPVRRRVALDPTWQEAAAASLERRADELGYVARRKAVTGMNILDEAAEAYVQARGVADQLAAQFASAAAGHDALIAPTMPVTAPKIGTWSSSTYSTGDDEYDVPLAYNTRPANLAGVPAVTLPAGTVGGLPVGLQLIGERYGDHELFAIASTVEAHWCEN